MVVQKAATTGQWRSMGLAVSRGAAHRGKPASAAERIFFRRSTYRVWILD
jgi:hypothetical protein